MIELKSLGSPIETKEISIKANVQQLWELLQKKFLLFATYRRAERKDFFTDAKMIRVEMRVCEDNKTVVHYEEVVFYLSDAYEVTGGSNFHFSIDDYTTGGEWEERTLSDNLFVFFVVPKETLK